MPFSLQSTYQPTGDQPQAISKLTHGINSKDNHQVLLGVTGSGKSLGYDEPVFIVEEGTTITTKVTPIGKLIDELFSIHQTKKTTDGTEILFTKDLSNRYLTQSYDTSTGQVSLFPVSAFTRHASPKQLFKVSTKCGRSALVTGDHNFWVLRNGTLVLTETEKILNTDHVPLPLKAECKGSLTHLNTLDILDDEKVFVESKESLTKYVTKFGIKKFNKILKKTNAFEGLWNPQKTTIGARANYHRLPAQIELNEDWLRFWGYYIAEGCYAKGYIVLSNHNTHIRNDLQAIFKALNLRFTTRKSSDFVIASTVISLLFKKLLGNTAANKKLPFFWPQLNNPQLGNLLRAYFDGDGTVSKNGEIIATTMSEQLASDLSYALSTLGIWSRIKKKYKKATNTNHKGNWYYFISISGNENLKTFNQHIGFTTTHKKQRLDNFLHLRKNTNVDLIPNIGKTIKSLRNTLNLKQSDLAATGLTRNMLSFIENDKRSISRASLITLLDRFENVATKKNDPDSKWVEVIQHLRNITNVHWTPVSDVQKVTYKKKHVYDLSVPGPETFLAGFGGLFVHNTFTMANVIEQVKKPTLIIAHNKTLAAQLYQEFRDFFPNNAVSYFVSYYDYYQPEAYIPSSDTYIEKDSSINDEIDKLRLASTTNLLTRQDVIVVASVSCIYNLGSPVEYGKYVLRLVEGEVIARETILLQLANLQYERSETELFRGSFRVRGDTIQVWPAYEERALRIDTLEHRIEHITWIDPISGSPLSGSRTPVEARKTASQLTNKLATQKTKLENEIKQGLVSENKNPQALAEAIAQLKQIADQENDDQNAQSRRKEYIIYPAKHYMMDPKSQTEAIQEIRSDLASRVTELTQQGKKLEAYRLQQKVTYDLEMITELGFVNGVENYSRYFDGRQPGDAPFSLLDYFAENAKNFNTNGFLTIVDESHITLPQIRGMYNGDQARKKTLIEYGFRLPSALDNRPLKFDEFLGKNDQFIHVSATPADWELSHSQGKIIEQVVRPTGLLDPQVELRPTEGQIEDLVIEILNRVEQGQRTLVTTLTKKMAEALTDYLNDHIKIVKLVQNFKRKLKTQIADRELQNSNMNLADPDQTLWTGNHHKKWNGQDIPVDDLEIGPVPEQYVSQAQIESKLAAKNDTEITFPKVAYLHSDIDTIERSDILDDLRRGTYDVLVGINLLREGLDLPEVTLVAILDADKEGFLRSSTSLIQTMGRAARHSQGHVICYADRLTQSMQKAIGETQRRRQVQIAYNTKHGIDPKTILKPIRERMTQLKDEDVYADENGRSSKERKQRKQLTSQNPERNRVKKIPSNIILLSKSDSVDLATFNPADLTPLEKKQYIKKFTTKMKRAADTMDYELATILRDFIKEMKN